MMANPDLTPDQLARLQKKPERRRYVKNRERAKKKLTRRQVIQVVYGRESMRCERCGRRVKKPSDCLSEVDPAMAHVNELVPRSKGGNPLDPDNCELTCQGCHMPGGQHAPTVERMHTLTRGRRRRTTADAEVERTI